MTNFIPGPIAPKIVTLGGYFRYLWTAKDQNINFGLSFSIQMAYQPRFISQILMRAHCSPPPHLPEPLWNRVNWTSQCIYNFGHLLDSTYIFRTLW